MKVYSFGAGGGGGIGGPNASTISRATSGGAFGRGGGAFRLNRAGNAIRVGGRNVPVRLTGTGRNRVARESATGHIIGRAVGGRNARVIPRGRYARGATTEARGAAARARIQGQRRAGRAAATRAANARPAVRRTAR